MPVPTLEIRRHAERSDRGNEESALSPAGRAMADSLAQRNEKYALVLSSPLPRAKETAQRIAGRLDAIEAGLLPEMGGVIGDRIFGEMRTLADWAEVLREREDARAFAQEQLAAWKLIASRVGERERILAVSHGGIIELPALTLGQRLRARLDGSAFGYCEGVRVTYAKGEPTAIEAVRL
jgi:broad specificity phosphatase PhoE